MKPLDIDGNELRVGDDVEYAKEVSSSKVASGCRQPKIGERFTIIEIGENYSGFISAKVEPLLCIACEWLRLIPRDKKADNNISWKSEVRA